LQSGIAEKQYHFFYVYDWELHPIFWGFLWEIFEAYCFLTAVKNTGD
jgi:hypothetical protein